MRIFTVVLATFAFGLTLANAQVLSDDKAETGVANPAFLTNDGPIVAVDSAHHNYHTIDNRYRPFASLLRNDGFRVVDTSARFTAKVLARTKVLVVANALPTEAGMPMPTPTPSALTQAEIDAVKQWVANGGSLLMITDHMPFAGGVSKLALAFGFQLKDGATLRLQPVGPPGSRTGDTFSIASGALKDDVITRGRNASERIAKIETFTGSAFTAPPDARPLLVFPQGYWIFACGLPCPGTVSRQNARGFLQGAVRVVGKGRVAMFAEAAMFSAQVMPTNSPPFRFGFNAPGAEQNKQFILNVMHWLAGILPA
jgi:hypothetical protein